MLEKPITGVPYSALNYINVDNPQDADCYLDKHDEPISNFLISRIAYYSEVDNNGKAEPMVVLELKRTDGQSTHVPMPLEDVKKLKTTRHFPEGIHNYCSAVIFNKLMHYKIFTTLSCAEPQEFRVVDQGFNYDPVLKRHYYGLVDKTINADDSMPLINKCEIKLKPMALGKNYIDLINKITNSEVFPACLLLTVLSTFVKHLLEEGNDSVYGYTVYIYGKTGTGKTTILKFYIDLFEGSCNIVNLSSDKIAIKQLGEIHDFPVAVDDVNLTTSSRVRNANEAKMIEFIQQNQGAGNSTYKGIVTKINTVEYMTAEYLPKSYSSLNRCLLVEIKEPFDPDELTYLMDNKPKYIKFIYDFIEWICKNHDRLKTKAVNELAACKNDYKRYDASQYDGLHRVLNTKHLLEITLSLFKLFLKEVLDIDSKLITKISESMEKSIESCINDTLGHIDISDNGPGFGFIEPIIANVLYQQLDSIVTNNWKEYKEDSKKSKKLGIAPKYVFFYDGQCLCIRGDRLVAWLKKRIGLNEIPTKQAVSKQLSYHGLLKVVGGEYVSHINIAEKPKGDYYHIYLSRLKEIDQNIQRKKYGKVFRDYYDLEWAGESRGSKYYGSWGDSTNDHDDDLNDDSEFADEEVDNREFVETEESETKESETEVTETEESKSERQLDDYCQEMYKKAKKRKKRKKHKKDTELKKVNKELSDLYESLAH